MKEVTSIELNNALFSEAKLCNQALKTALKKNPKTPFNQITTPILKRHHEKISALCSLLDLVHAIGVLNGRYNDYR